MAAKKEIFLTTDEDFNLYKQETEYWQRYWGLLHWRLICLHSHIGGFCANIFWDKPNRRAITRFNTKYPTKPDHREICSTAFHEMAELLLSPMQDYMEGNAKILEAQTHSVISILENTVFRVDYDRRFGDKTKATSATMATFNYLYKGGGEVE